MKTKDLPLSELPREKMLLYGVNNLTNQELLSIILRTGTKDISVFEVANNILAELGDITNLKEKGVRELANIKGVGSVKAITLLACLELGKRVNKNKLNKDIVLNNSKIINETFKSEFINLKQEKFLAIYLDIKKRLISFKTISIGTISKTLVHSRDVFNEAIKLSASSIVVMHNHPSNDVNPSNEDFMLTNNLMESGELLGIPVVDHIITNGEDYYSFYEEKNK